MSKLWIRTSFIGKKQKEGFLTCQKENTEHQWTQSNTLKKQTEFRATAKDAATAGGEQELCIAS